jgi:RHS repeat-associated protein
MYHFANGYIDIEQGHVKAYCYYAKDHLGNVRHVDMANPRTNRNEIVQVNNYYPFGGIMDEGSRRGADIQNHLYNGKELDRMHGLNLYDFSARQYDATLGQFTSMDPLYEKYYHISPYAYCAGNPVKYVDPDGKAIKILYVDTRGRVQHYVFRDTGQKGYVKIPKSRNNFVKNVVGAYFYNKRNFTKMFPGEQNGLMKLVQREDNKNTVGVVERKNDNAYAHLKNTIFWDPNAACKYCLGGYHGIKVDNVPKKHSPELYEYINKLLYDEDGWRKIIIHYLRQDGFGDDIDTPEMQTMIDECMERVRKSGDVYPK